MFLLFVASFSIPRCFSIFIIIFDKNNDTTSNKHINGTMTTRIKWNKIKWIVWILTYKFFYVQKTSWICATRFFHQIKKRTFWKSSFVSVELSNWKLWIFVKLPKYIDSNEFLIRSFAKLFMHRMEIVEKRKTNVKWNI